MEGADIYQIAKNCRTSVEMIEKYYAAHIKTNLDAAVINVMRPKPKKKGKIPAACFMMRTVTRQPCGRGGMADAEDLSKLECPPGNRRCRTAQIRGNLLHGNPEPSP
jgi:hypothetical protein